MDDKMIYNHIPNLPLILYPDHKNAAEEILFSRHIEQGFFLKIKREGRRYVPMGILFISDAIVINPSTENFD